MPDPQKMPCFVKADFRGPQIRLRRIFVLEPVKRDYGSLAAKLGFTEHEFEYRSAQVALDDPQLKFAPSAIDSSVWRIFPAPY